MKKLASLTLFASLLATFLAAPTAEASGGDEYASLWKCSDGNTYGLVAKGNKRDLYLPTLHAPLFFSGIKNGDSYAGTIYQGNQQIPVSGPVSKQSTRVTLYAQDGRAWVLDFLSKPAAQPRPAPQPAPGPSAGGQDQYASYWKCSDGNTYGLTAKGNKRALYLPTGASPLFFSGVKSGDAYHGTVYLGNQQVPVSGPVTNNSTRVTLYAQDGRSWVLNFSHR